MALESEGPPLGQLAPDFLVWRYKVEPCTKAYAHDWQACTAAHAGERAARRCPRNFSYTPVACPFAKRRMACPDGDTCTNAHNLYEYWLHPDRFRTEICSHGQACTRPVCFFAHSVAELRPLPGGLPPGELCWNSSSNQRSSGAQRFTAARVGISVQTGGQVMWGAPPQLSQAGGGQQGALMGAGAAAAAAAGAPVALPSGGTAGYHARPAAAAGPSGGPAAAGPVPSGSAGLFPVWPAASTPMMMPLAGPGAYVQLPAGHMAAAAAFPQVPLVAGIGAGGISGAAPVAANAQPHLYAVHGAQAPQLLCVPQSPAYCLQQLQTGQPLTDSSGSLQQLTASGSSLQQQPVVSSPMQLLAQQGQLPVSPPPRSSAPM